MGKHLMKVNVNSKEFDELIETMDEVRQKLYDCINKLARISFLDVDAADKEEAASDD